MAEGMTRLNQQVVDAGYWDRPDLSAPRAGRSRPRSPDLVEARPRSPEGDDVRRAVEADIIPRLLGARDRPDRSKAGPWANQVFAEAEVERFASTLLAPGSDRAAAAQIDEARARGVTVDDIYLHLFQSAARHIGELWGADLCSFVDATLALGTMQTLMRALGSDFHKAGRPADASRQALLVPLHGDQHTFGLAMVAEFFRRAGWSVWNAAFASRDDLGAAVRDTRFTVIGFSAACGDRLDDVASAIRMVRQESCNGAIGVLVGGPLFVGHPDHARGVGADGWGADARQAVAQAETFAAFRAGP